MRTTIAFLGAVTALLAVLLGGSPARAQGATDVTSVTLHEGRGRAAEKGDRITLMFQGKQAGTIIDNASDRTSWDGGTSYFSRSFTLGENDEHPARLFSVIEGMRAGEKRRITIPRKLIEASWTSGGRLRIYGDVEYEVEVEKVERPAVAPTPPDPWTLTVDGGSFRMILSSDGGVIRSLEYRFRDKWAPLLDANELKGASGWLGATINGSPVTFVRCEVESRGYVQHFVPIARPKGASPDETMTVTGKFGNEDVTLCSWELGERSSATKWDPTIGAVVLEYRIGLTPPRIRLSKRTGTAKNVKFAGYGSDDTPIPHAAVLDSCQKYPDYLHPGTVCTSPFAFLSFESHAPGGSLDGQSDLADIYLGLRDEVDGMVPGYNDVRRGFSWFPLQIVGGILGLLARPLGTELWLVVLGAGLALLVRRWTREERVSALRSFTPSPWEKLGRDAKLITLGILFVPLAITRWVFASKIDLLQRSSLYEPTIGGSAPYPVLLALIAALFVAAWAYFGKRSGAGTPADKNAIFVRALWIVPALVLAAGGPWVLLPTSAMFGWAMGDLVLRRSTTGSSFQQSLEQTHKKFGDAIRSAQLASWPRLVTGAREALARGTSGAERVMCAAVIASSGDTAGALKAIADVEPMPPEALRYAAFVFAKAGDSSQKTRERLRAAVEQPPTDEPIEAAFRGAIEAAFPAALAAERLPEVAEAARRTRPDWIWALEAGALSLLAQGKAQEAAAALTLIATEHPEVLAGREENVADAVLAAGAASNLTSRVLGRLANEAPERQAAHLALVDAIVGAGTPLSPDSAAALRSAAGQQPSLVLARLLLAAGDTRSALQAAAASTSTPAEAAWIEARAALASGDRSAIAAVLAKGADALGPAGEAEIALALDDRAALERLVGPLSSTPMPRGRRLLLARVLLALDHAGRARETLDAMPQGSAEATLLLARANVQLGHAREAVEALSGLVSAYPWWREARYRLGCAAAHARDSNAAAAAFVAAEKAGDPRANVMLAEILRQRGDTRAAAQLVDAVLASGGSHPSVLRTVCEVAIAVRAVDRAKDAFSRLASLAPRAPLLPTLDGALRELAGDLDGARAAYARAGAWGRLVLIAVRQGDTNAATEALAQLGDRELERTTSAAVLDAVAVASAAREDYGRTDRALSRLLGLRPTDAETRQKLADLRLARAARAIDEGAGGMAAARDLLEDALVKTADARIARALTEIDLNDVRAAVVAGSADDREKARAVLERMRQRAPDDPRGVLFTAALDLAAGRLAAVEASLASLDRNVWASLLRGLSLAKAGKRAEAISILSRAVAFPDPKLATSAWLAGIGHDLDASTLETLRALAAGGGA